MVDQDSDRVSRAPPYSGTVLRSLHHFAYGDFTLSVRLSQNLSAILKFSQTPPLAGQRPYNPALMDGLGSSSFARRYFRNHFYFLFPGYLDGSVPPVSLPYPIYSNTDNSITTVGLPHSAINGSKDVCSSPSLFAACHGLLRLDTPRHPP